MSDLIKRSDAIEAVWKPQVKPNELIFDALKTAIESEINNVPSADRPQWIPCSESLPAEGEVVLVCMKLQFHKAEWEEQRSIEFGRINSKRYDFDGIGWEWLNESGADYWQGDWNNSIIAWMPLPEPYHGGEEQ